jgi:hypothetical protein
LFVAAVDGDMGANHGWKGSNHCDDQTHLRLYRIFFFFFFFICSAFGLSEPMRFHFLLGFPLAPGITTMQHQKQKKKNKKKQFFIREKFFFFIFVVVVESHFQTHNRRTALPVAQ